MLETFSVRVSGPGVEVTRDVDQTTAFQVLSVLMGISPTKRSMPVRGVTPDSDEVTDTDDMTIGEFLSELNISNNAERIAGIALFQNERQGERLVAKEDLPSLFQRSGEAPPKNLTRDLRVAITRRLVSEDHAKAGHYFVTKSGTDLLRKSGSQAPATVRPATRKRGRSAQAPDDDAKSGKGAVRPATKSGKGPYERVLDLKRNGWLDDPRNLQEIIAELTRRGAVYKRTDLTRQMMMLTDRGELTRVKKSPPEGGREVWHYTAS